MLILTRKPGQTIKIQPAADLPLTTPAGALLGRSRRPGSRDIRTSVSSTEGPIEIVVQRPLLRILRPRHSGIPAQHIQGQQVRIGIQAHDKFLILREELEVSGSLPTSSQAAG